MANANRLLSIRRFGMPTQLMSIALGGALGAVGRYWVSSQLYALLGRGFPHATLFVNVSGSFAMGLLSQAVFVRYLPGEWRSGVLVGFLGAYTTFSTFSVETLGLFEQGLIGRALVNTLVSSLGCVGAVWLGAQLGRALPGFATLADPSLLRTAILYGALLVVAAGLGIFLKAVSVRFSVTPALLYGAVLCAVASVAVLQTWIVAEWLPWPSTAVNSSHLAAVVGVLVVDALASALALVLGFTLAERELR